MDTTSKSGRARTDSGVDNVESISKTLSEAQSLCTAVSSFASDNSFQALTELIGLLPKQNDELEEKNELIRDLNTKLVNQEDSHNAFTRLQLSSFEDRYAAWIKERSTLLRKVQELEAISKQGSEEIMALRRELKETQAKVVLVEDGCAQMTKTLKQKDQILGDLEAKLQISRRNLEECASQQQQSNEQVAALKRSNASETEKVRTLEEKETKARNRVKDFVEFSVEIKKLDLEKIIDQMETLWKSAINIIIAYFSQDFPSQILQSDWTNLRENDVFKHRYTLPQSNSDIAKKMRVATVLGTFAKLVDKFLFQPTFLMHEDSGLRDILCRLAVKEPTKERYTRGILLSMFPEDQEANSEDAICFVMEDLFTAVNVEVLLGVPMAAEFKTALEGVASQFQETWRVIQRGKQRLESSFLHSTTEERPWHVFDIDVADVKNSKYAKAKLLPGEIEDGDIVIIPRLYRIVPEEGSPPITSGCILRKVHIDAAEQEVRKSLPSAPFVRVTSNRHRNRSMRSASLNGENVSKQDK